MPDSQQRRGTPRRVVLLGGLAAFTTAAMGCSPDEARVVGHQLDAALRRSRTLLARYDVFLAAAAPTDELFAAIRADHEAHAAELAQRIGPGASLIAAEPPTGEESAKSLRKAEADAYKEAVEQCVASDDPQTARLLASIAASRATHRELIDG